MKSKEDEYSDSNIEIKTNFFDNFKIVIVSEIGFNSVVISRCDIKTNDQLSDHSTLVRPDYKLSAKKSRNTRLADRRGHDCHAQY